MGTERPVDTDPHIHGCLGGGRCTATRWETQICSGLDADRRTAELGQVLLGTRQVQVQTRRPLVSMSELLGSSVQDKTCTQVAAGSGRVDLPSQGQSSVPGKELEDFGHQAATPCRSFPSARPAQNALRDHRSGCEQ